MTLNSEVIIYFRFLMLVMGQPDTILRLEAIILQDQNSSFLFSAKFEFDHVLAHFLEFACFTPYTLIYTLRDVGSYITKIPLETPNP